MAEDAEVFVDDGVTLSQIADDMCDDHMEDISGPNAIWECDDGNDWEVSVAMAQGASVLERVSALFLGTGQPAPGCRGVP